MPTSTYSGVYSIPVTPFNEDKSIDLESLNNCLEFLVEKGSDGIVLPVNVSEASRLSDKEKDLVLQTAVNVIDGEVPLIAGITGATTASAIIVCASGVLAFISIRTSFSFHFSNFSTTFPVQIILSPI